MRLWDGVIWYGRPNSKPVNFISCCHQQNFFPEFNNLFILFIDISAIVIVIPMSFLVSSPSSSSSTSPSPSSTHFLPEFHKSLVSTVLLSGTMASHLIRILMLMMMILMIMTMMVLMIMTMMVLMMICSPQVYSQRPSLMGFSPPRPS